MSEAVEKEKEAPGADLEDFRGFVEFMAQSFYRASGETDYFAEGFRDLLLKRDDISVDERIDIAFELGRLDHALYILKRLYKDGPLGDYLDRPEIIKRFLKAISPVMELYLSFKDGKAVDIHKVRMVIGGAAGDIYSIIQDGLEEIENERC